jgi:hypothetical protein
MELNFAVSPRCQHGESEVEVSEYTLQLYHYSDRASPKTVWLFVGTGASDPSPEDVSTREEDSIYHWF